MMDMAGNVDTRDCPSSRSLEVLLVRRDVRPYVISQPIHRTDRTEQRVLRRLKVLDGTIFGRGRPGKGQ